MNLQSALDSISQYLPEGIPAVSTFDFAGAMKFLSLFAGLALLGRVTAQDFLTVYTVVVSFYFGTQFERNGGKGA